MESAAPLSNEPNVRAPESTAAAPDGLGFVILAQSGSDGWAAKAVAPLVGCTTSTSRFHVWDPNVPRAPANCAPFWPVIRLNSLALATVSFANPLATRMRRP